MRKLAFVLFVLLPPLPSAIHSQDAIPREMLDRTFLIKVGDVVGTAFSVGYDDRMYLVTARHIVAGLQVERPTILVWQQGEWKEIPTRRTLFASPLDVDVAVLETYMLTRPHLSPPFPITAAEHTKPTVGQKVWCLGYPVQSTNHPASLSIAPVIKQGTISEVDASNPNAFALRTDGLDDVGFSGSPILYWDPDDHLYRILGMVRGTKNDASGASSRDRGEGTNNAANSGILLGYAIDYAMKAITR